jgi:transposase
MAGARLSMHKTREILRQKWVQGRSHREVARSQGVSVGMVAATLDRARAAGFDEWAAIEGLSETELETRLYGPPRTGSRPLPDPLWIHTERQRKGVTLELLHHEYLEAHPDGYRYTQFCEHYRRWCRKRKLSMRQVHRAGEKLFVDYAGHKPRIVDRSTGEEREVELFVATLGASSFTYAEATETQRVADFIGSHTRALAYFGGVPELVIPDQLKSGVTRACRYEPGLQRSYEEWSHHVGTTLLPARPKKPRDKAKVEVAVQVVERWILARIRDETFFSLRELNVRIWELLEALNDRPMRAYGQSRRERFALLDRPALRPLPQDPFELAVWKHAKVNLDCHVEFDKRFYSIPHPLVGEAVEIRATRTRLEVFRRGERVALHVRPTYYAPGGFSTIPEHLPKAHRKHLEWTPTRLIDWGESVGPKTGALVQSILEHRPHPEQGYRSCLGILRLSKRYGKERLEAACERALEVRARSYRHVESILKHGLDRLPKKSAPKQRALPLLHENVRGGDYYN